MILVWMNIRGLDTMSNGMILSKLFFMLLFSVFGNITLEFWSKDGSEKSFIVKLIKNIVKESSDLLY